MYRIMCYTIFHGWYFLTNKDGERKFDTLDDVKKYTEKRGLTQFRVFKEIGVKVELSESD